MSKVRQQVQVSTEVKPQAQEHELPELPMEWEWTTIGEFVTRDGLFIDGDWVESKDQDPNGEVRLVQLADVGEGIYKNKSSRFLTAAKAEELSCTFLEPGDVLIARLPDPLGRACLFPGDAKPCVTVVDVCIVRTGEEGIDHRWLMHTLNSPDMRSLVASFQSGSTRLRISRGNLARIQIPLPPLNEQRRIVAKVEELLSDLEAGVATLKQAQTKLKRYRQAVLKAAVEGELSREWREANKDRVEPAEELLKRILGKRRSQEEKVELKNKRNKGEELFENTQEVPGIEIPTSQSVGLSGAPEGWIWVATQHLADEATNPIGAGPFGTIFKAKDFRPHGVPIIFLRHVSPGRYLTKKPEFMDSQKWEELFKSYSVFGGELLVTKLGDPPGVCAI